MLPPDGPRDPMPNEYQPLDADERARAQVSGGRGYATGPRTGAFGDSGESGESGERKVPDLALSHVRTITPYLVAYALTWLGSRIGIESLSDLSPHVSGAAVVGLGSLYYALARALERVPGRRRTRAALRGIGRWMLGGVVRQPVYTRPPVRQSTVIEPGGEVRRPE